VTTTTPGDDPGDNDSSTTTEIRWPDLAIHKDDGVTTVQPGDVLLYTITVTNTGTVTATNLRLTETPPPGSLVRSAGWTAQAAGSWTHTIAQLAPGERTTRLFAIQLPDLIATAQITNTVQVEDSIPGDPTPADTSSTDRDQVHGGRLGDMVWDDRDGDRQQDSNEPGLPDVRIQILDPATRTLLTTTSTTANGTYLVEGLRWGEYLIQLDPQTTLSGAYAGYRLTTDAVLRRTVTSSTPTDLTADFGLREQSSTAVVLSMLQATPTAEGLLVTWETIREVNTARFELWRSTTPHRDEATLVASMPARSTSGARYQVLDPSMPATGATYWLVEVERDGTTTVVVGWNQSGSSTNTAAYHVFVPLIAPTEAP
jgi:uncharacterized repeat protein (TIGR01451 family)